MGIDQLADHVATYFPDCIILVFRDKICELADRLHPTHNTREPAGFLFFIFSPENMFRIINLFSNLQYRIID